MSLFSNTISTLENALNYSSTKQKVIAQNISNVDTPNYKSKEVSFKSELQTAMDHAVAAKRTDVRHFNFENTSSTIVISTNKSTSYQNNGNNVDIDKEMADLATNQIYYNALIERISGKFQTLQSVIRGGK